MSDVKIPRYLGGELYADGETWRSSVGVPGEWEAVFAVRFSRANPAENRLVSLTRDLSSPTEAELRQAASLSCCPRSREDWERATAE